jgi:1-aminocyclopropane-1-carboxylate deaminase/D-cysteine desulfhydrase-like pyridoxal-dependent ACC family enzyme
MNDPIIQQICQQLSFSPWGLAKSRIHQTKSFGDGIWVKRDDELSFGISGTKLRKLSSVISYLKASQTKLVVTTGGLYSNHLPAAVQAFNEAGLDYQIWLKKGDDKPAIGNYGLLQLLVRSGCIRWVKPDDWDQRYEMMEKACQRLSSNGGGRYFVMREGVDNRQALAGAMTLAIDIARNQREHQIEFETIAIDAGTAGSAIGLILGLELLNLKKHIIVVGMAMRENAFFESLHAYNELLPQVIGAKPCRLDLSRIHYHRAVTAKSFGATNTKVFKQISDLAKAEGILVDPIYGAKLTLTIKGLLAERKLAKPLLWIHSGGAFSISGFWDKLSAHF